MIPWVILLLFLVDVAGRIHQTHIHAANLHDSPQGVNPLELPAGHSARLEKTMADRAYRGTFVKAVEKTGVKFETPERPDNTKGFVAGAKGWVVERTFARLNFFRRTVTDYEHAPESSALFLLLANISMCLWRIDF